MSKIVLIEKYVAKHVEQVDLMIEQVCELLPDSYFYAPEFHSGAFLMKRQEMDEYRKKLAYPAYRNNSSLKRQLAIATKEYSGLLKGLANSKREALRAELLQEELEMQCACLINLIRQHGLLKHMRTFS